MYNPNDSKSRTPPMSEPSYNSYPQAGYPYPQHPPNAYGMAPPPAYEGPSSPRTTSPAGTNGEPSMMSRLQGSVGANPADILNNAAPGFSRAPPNSLPYSPFPPCALVSLSHELDKGFPTLAPPAMVQPHPFALHDIQEADWMRFLSDVKRSGTLSPMNHVVAGVAPLAMGIGLLGILVSRGIEKRMKQKKVGPVTEIIDHWNYYFFNPRQTEVVLFHGDHAESGPAYVSSRGPSPDSSDPEDYGDRRQRRGGRLGEQRARRAERRGEMGGRRERRRQERDVRKEKWQLVVSYKPRTPY